MSFKKNNYHDYVIRDGKFIRDFDQMYKNCDDPWNQDTNIHISDFYVLDLTKSIFGPQHIKIMDIGFGKGM